MLKTNLTIYQLCGFNHNYFVILYGLKYKFHIFAA